MAQRRSSLEAAEFPFYFEDLALVSYCGQAQTSAQTPFVIGCAAVVTVFWKKTKLHVSCMYLWSLTKLHYFDMDNKLQLLLTVLSLLAAAVQLNSGFYHVTTAYMCRRKDLIWANCDSSRVQWRYQPHIDWYNFINGDVVPEEWQEKLSHVGSDLPRSTWRKHCVRMWRERQEYGHVWMFSQRWPARCINITRSDYENF